MKKVNFRYMKNILRAVVVVVALAAAVACEKTEVKQFVVPSGSILLTAPGQTGTASFLTHNITSIRVVSYPDGWRVDDIDLYEGTITVTAPSTFDDDEATEGKVSLIGYTPTGATQSVSVYVAILQNPDVDYRQTPSNCYIATKPDTRYLFDPFRRGTSGEPLQTESVELLWQSSNNLVKYLTFKDGVASFYIEKAESEDKDDKEKPDAVTPGNAVIAARNAAGDIIWSWHIWVTTTDPAADAVEIAGRTVMNRNLGANVNSNGEADEEKILHSYGMYYQWGRKDPLVGAASYDFSGNTDARMYNSAGRRIYLQYTASDASTGTVEYAVAHPDAMITGAENNGFDWLYSQHDDTLWSETGAKSDYDPCPAGWRVAAGDIFAALTISPEDDGMDWMQAKKMYGWHLEDTATGKTYFFTAGGRRNYFDGRLDNVNSNPDRPLPWTGYYWSCNVSGDDARCMFFDLNTVTRTYNGYEPHRNLQRANATPLRCVKQ